jgi:pimeloyl-ACP methyl ester carboxylesterase
MTMIHLGTTSAFNRFTLTFDRFIETASDFIAARLKKDFESDPFIVSIPLTEYRLLGAFYVEKEKHARLMDAHGILRRDELDVSLMIYMASFKFNYETLFTLAPNGRDYCFYNKETQEIELYNLESKEQTRSYTFPLTAVDCIDIGQEGNLHLVSLFNPNYLVITVSTIDSHTTSKHKVQSVNLWSLNLETGERRKITTHHDEQKALIAAEKKARLAQLQAQIDEYNTDIQSLKTDIEKAFPTPSYIDHLRLVEKQIKDYLDTGHFVAASELTRLLSDLQQAIQDREQMLANTARNPGASITTGYPNNKTLALNRDLNMLHAIRMMIGETNTCRQKQELLDTLNIAPKILREMYKPLLDLSQILVEMSKHNPAAQNSPIRREIDLLKTHFGKNLGPEFYDLADYPMDMQQPTDEVIYFYSDYALDDVTKNITGDLTTKVCAYNLVSGKTRIMNIFGVFASEMALGRDLKVSNISSNLNKEFKAYKVDKKGLPEAKFSLSAEEHRYVKPFSYDEDHVLLMDARFTDKKTPVLRSLTRNMEMPLLSEKEEASLKSDVKGALVHPKTKEVFAYDTYYDKSRLHLRTPEGTYESFSDEDMVDPSRIAYGLSLLKNMREQTGANFSLRTAFGFDYKTENSIKNFVLTIDPETADFKITKLGSHKKASNVNPLTRSKLSKTEPFTFNARDGLKIQAYLTLPVNVKTHENLPTVLLIHGGPMSRDKLELNPQVEFWASRGFAVVQINFRGSKTFGKEFLKSAWGDWHGKMTDDLIDGLDHLKKQGIVDSGRIIAAGTSYGAFATTSLLTKYPDYFQCGVAINGPFDLVTDFKDIMDKKTIFKPEDWTMQFGADLRITDRYEEEEAKLKAQSTTTYIPHMTKPLLLISGSKDDTCLPKQSANFAREAKKWGKSVTHVEFKDEGHSFSLDNYPHLMGVQENFVAQYVPGIYAEPMEREMKQNPAIKVKTTSRY